MIQNHKRIALALLIVGLIAVEHVAHQPAVPYSVPRFADLETPVATNTPVPAAAREFDGDGPVGLSLLNEHAEVLFDISPRPPTDIHAEWLEIATAGRLPSLRWASRPRTSVIA